VVNTYEVRTTRVLAPATVQLLSDVWEGRERRDTPPPPDNVVPVPGIEPDDKAFPEGAIKQRLHLARERNRTLVAAAKNTFKKQHGGRLYCQVCAFDFNARYGPLGDDYIEAHHTVLVSELTEGSTTRIDDLAMVCANCHRMLHRRRPWLRMEELRQLLR
jgi:putative restriction endonuclease